MAHINYETDLLKHYVRTRGWLPACQEQKRAIRRRSKRIPLRYFTFCAAQAIDVFLLEHEGILTRDHETGRLEGVFFCEQDEQDFGQIADLIGSPEQGFLGEFDKIVLFEDDESTQGLELYTEIMDEPYPDDLRRKLRLKDANRRLQNAFPFDVINLDVFGVMFPPRRGVITPLLQSIIRILEWQTTSTFPINDRPCKQFTLFLTSHLDRDITDDNAIEQLANRVSENIDTNSTFRNEFVDRYGHNSPESLIEDNFAEFFCLALPKFIVQVALFDLGWEVEYGPIFLYNRDDKYRENRQYQIMHSIAVYRRITNFGQRLDAPSPGQYSRTVTEVVQTGPSWVPKIEGNPELRRELQQDLHAIVEFRNQVRGL